MTYKVSLWVLFFLALSSISPAQIITGTTGSLGPESSIGGYGFDLTEHNLLELGRTDALFKSPLEMPSGSVSKFDLQAPGKARGEYEKGYQLLMKKDLTGAVEHLTRAVTIYPKFIAAHNALGSAYMNLDQPEQARLEFAQSASLDEHLPISFLNLGAAQLALKDYSGAEDSLKKASSIAPLDVHLLTALAYGELMNRDYPASVATVVQIHGRKHPSMAKVHLYAAAAWQAQNNFAEAQNELQTFLLEDPKSPSAPKVTQMIQQLKEAALHPPEPAAAPAQPVSISYATGPDAMSTNGIPDVARNRANQLEQTRQVAELEAEAACPTCETTASAGPAPNAARRAGGPNPNASARTSGFLLRASADEVAVFFAATDHGRTVADLTNKEVGVRDDRRPPAVITGFRNEAELPLRLGIVIDTSSSVTDRFKFEQEAAVNFLQKVLTGKDDQAFVIGVANSVLLVQDFTNDQSQLSRAVDQLVPAGGTALWDAVEFAAGKLASQQQQQADKPLAKILVVISDGENNSSSSTLKEAVDQAQRGEVAIYTVSTREVPDGSQANLMTGERALRTMAELTGGASFNPGSARKLNTSLADLQQVIHSRYLISYKPDHFQRNGQYRAINITATKDGRKLRIYARKGYFATTESPQSAP